jgi:hypothetical protein
MIGPWDFWEALEKSEDQPYFVDEASASSGVDSERSSGSLVSKESLAVDSVAVVVLVEPTAAVVSTAASAVAESSAFAVPTVTVACGLATDLHRDPEVAVGPDAQPSGCTRLSAVMWFAGTAAGSQLLI